MAPTTARNADAARYVVLRKLAAGIRHALMGELQAIQFAADLAGQLLKNDAAVPRLAEVVSQIPEHTGGSIKASQAIFEWLRPDERARTEVDPAVRHCLKLVGDVWILRGVNATAHCPTGGRTVPKAMFIELLVTSLLTLTDLHSGPLDIDVVAEAVGQKVIVRLSARPAHRRYAPAELSYRALTSDDVAALAELHGIACRFNGMDLALEFPSSSESVAP